ncbi:MAG: hypothetical protein ACK4WM_11630 [Thermoflexales bacterium]
MSDALAQGLDGLAEAAARLHSTRIVRLIFVALSLGSVVGLMVAQPGRVENQSIRDTTPAEVDIGSIGTYVRVTGILDTQGAYRTQYRLGVIQLQGGRYIPLVVPGSAGAVYVLDEGLPPHAPDEFVTVVGQVVTGIGAQPPLFIQVGYPPNVVLAHTLARCSGVALLGLLTLAALGAWMRGQSYALALPFATPRDQHAAPDLLWFGSLGRAYDEAVVRNAAASFQATPFEGQLEGAGWRVVIRRLRAAQRFTVASRWGRLAAARVTFEDNFGLPRRGVIAARNRAILDAVLRVLSYLR